MPKDAGLAIYRMLPTGDGWPPETEDTNLRKLIYGLSKNTEDFISTLSDVMYQYYPGRAGIFVSDWEELLGLPKCSQTEQPLQTRIAQVLAMFRISPYNNTQFFVDIAAVFGYDITVIPDGPEFITVSGTTMFGGYYNGVYTKYDITNGRHSYRYLDVDIYLDTSTPYTEYTGWKLFHVGGPGLVFFNNKFNTVVPTTEWQPIASAPPPTIVLDPAFTPDPFKIEILVPGVVKIYFRVGKSSVGDPLVQDQAPGVLECILNFFKHTHTHLVFV